MKRISRGTPYILSAVDIDNMLGALTPHGGVDSRDARSQ